MIADLEKRLDAVCDSMETAEAQFHQTTACCVEALQGLHTRMERIEKWILESQEKREKP